MSDRQTLHVTTDYLPSKNHLLPSAEGPAFLSTLPANASDRRTALIMIAVSVLVFISLAPFAKTPLKPVWAFIPIYETVVVINDLFTALLLYGQFSILRQRPLAILASGYLFTGLMAAFHALTFPGLFTSEGLLGAGTQTTAWLYMFWHAGFPLFVIAYTLLKDRHAGTLPDAQSNSRFIAFCITLTTFLACGLALLTTAGHDLLPVLLGKGGYTSAMHFVASTVWAASLVALVVLYRRRSSTVLQLWLTVVVIAWLVDVSLSTQINAGRFDLGFYSGRIYGAIAASFILARLLFENTGLYAQLGITHARLAAQNQELQREINERLATEKALRNAEMELRTHHDQLNNILESISDAFVTLDSNWRYTYVNSEASKLLGRSEHELINANIWDVFPEAKDTLFERECHRAMRESNKRSFIEYYPMLSKWLEVHIYPAHEGIAVYFHDVTERQLANERMRLLEASVEKLNDAVLILNANQAPSSESEIVYTNGAFYRQTGFHPEKTFEQTLAKLHGSFAPSADIEALEHLAPLKTECIGYRFDGRKYWYDLDVVRVLDDAGRHTHWVVIIRDITEKKEIEMTLREQARLLDEATDAIIVRSLEDHILYWNKAAERQYGWRAEEVLGRSVKDVLYSSSQFTFDQAVAILKKHGDFSGRITHTRKDGSHIVVHSHWVLIRHEDGTPKSILAIHSDLTARIHLEERLFQIQKMDALGQLTGGIAHDFNNLLTVIVGSAELLEDEPKDTKTTVELAQMIQSAGMKGAELTNRLLAFARKQALEPKNVDLCEVIYGMRTLLERTLGEEIQLQFQCDNDAWHTYVDQVQLESALLNLSINSRDAMPNGGTLTIEVTNSVLDEDYAADNPDATPGQYVLLSVSDTGFGMSPEVAARAYEPFFTTKSRGEGSGLGLSMVYGFAMQSKGHIKLYSEPGRGTVVKLYLPRSTSQVGEAEIFPTPHLEGGPEHILMVEDDELVRIHGKRLLKEMGYVVSTANTGSEALTMLKSGMKCDLLFTDIVMPGGMTGFELASEALKIQPGLAVLYTSGYTEKSLNVSEASALNRHLLQKPYRRQNLIEKIKAALETNRMEQNDDRS